MDLDMHSRFKQAIDSIQKYGDLHATARAKSYYMQGMEKVILSRIQISFGDIPVSRAELRARASEEFEKHLKETSEAIENEHKLKNALEVAKARFEGNRSLSSLEKSTRNQIG